MSEQELSLDKMEKLLDEYAVRLRDLHSEISEQRKLGKDLLIPDSMLRNISSKMDWAKHNGKKHDFEIIENVFEKVKDEINEASRRKIVDIKQEIDERAKEEHRKESNSTLDIPEHLQPKLNHEPKPEAQLEKLLVEKPITKTESVDKKEVIKNGEEQKPLKEELIIDNPEKCFRLRDGRCLKSISDLANALPEISDDEFNFHIRDDDNDFSKWLAGVLGEGELAKKIKGKKYKQEMSEILKKEKR